MGLREFVTRGLGEEDDETQGLREGETGRDWEIAGLRKNKTLGTLGTYNKK